VYQLFARAYGTNNLRDCSNMCYESSGEALSQTIGVGKGSVSLEDIVKVDLILVVGQNPGTNHPRMLGTLEEAKGAGASIVCINPLRRRSTPSATAPGPRVGWVGPRNLY
jgi:formate dehydrogenase major subunit